MNETEALDFRFDKFSLICNQLDFDGVHPDSEVVDKWVIEMVKTMDKNAGIFREFDGEVCSTH